MRGRLRGWHCEIGDSEVADDCANAQCTVQRVRERARSESQLNWSEARSIIVYWIHGLLRTHMTQKRGRELRHLLDLQWGVFGFEYSPEESGPKCASRVYLKIRGILSAAQ